jgi:hypothetical protein
VNGATTFSIMILSTKDLFATLAIMLSIIMTRLAFLIAMLNEVMLSVVMLNEVMLSVVMLNVVPPL